MALKEIIIEKIQSEGPISFHDFMEMCLYYPEIGYYTSPATRIGKNGDYYTSPCVAPVFGAMVAKQLEEMWRLMGEKKFTIIEYGAGMGFLTHDILNYLRNNPKLYNLLDYWIIEKSLAMREREKLILTEKVKWYNSIREISEGISGCILSNELVDNFSVHQVIMDYELKEVFVDYKNDFVELLKPADEMLQNYLSELGVFLPNGFRTEINLEATEWIKDLSTCLKEGFILTIDYGYPSAELYRSYRRRGTLVCYHNHKINENPYWNIGEQDITSHVNFSALYHWGKKNGLDGCGLTDQAHFLKNLGFTDYLEKTKHQQDQSRYNEEYLKQILLTEMGSKFKIFIQRKGIPKQELTGLRI